MSKRNISNIVLHNAATATGDGVIINTELSDVSVIEIKSAGTFTIVFEGKSLSDNWYAISAINVTTLDISTQATTSGLYELDTSGLTSCRARISAIGASSVTVIAKLEG